MDLLFRGDSAGAFGTLAQLKVFFFGHKAVKKDVMQNYQHVVDLIQVNYLFYVFTEACAFITSYLVGQPMDGTLSMYM